MAGPKGSRYYDVFLRHQVEMVTDKKIIINEEGFRLLLALEKDLSIVSAARDLNISYRKAWGMIRDIELYLGFPLVGKKRGGSSGGKTFLTTEGKELLDAYRELVSGLESSDRDIIRHFFRRINQIQESS